MHDLGFVENIGVYIFVIETVGLTVFDVLQVSFSLI